MKPASSSGSEQRSGSPTADPSLPVKGRPAGRLFARPVWLLAGVHAVLFAAVYWVAYLLRFDFNVPPEQLLTYAVSVPCIVGLKIAVFYLTGHFHGWWRYVTFADLVALMRASAICFLLVAAVSFFGPAARIPRSVVILDSILGLLVVGSLRSSWRVFREHFWPILKSGQCRGAMLVGTDEATGILAHQMLAYTHLPFRIRGMLSTDRAERRERLGQIPILGHVDHLQRIAAACAATEVFVLAGAIAAKQLRHVMDICTQASLNLRIVPALADRLAGERHLPTRSIEINDLLGREPVQLDTDVIAKLIQGRTILVTGAGGSIGSEICRQVLRFNPRELILVGRGENRIFHIERELRSAHPLVSIRPWILDITNVARLRQVFDKHHPEVVFHAAAHKHVPLMEINVGEAIRNNILGTKTLADLAHQNGVKSFVLVSTDKAVRPTSVMGVSKHMAERYVHALSQESTTRFAVVRFGNVLGSAGSVVPIFQDQIRRGGPITVTDPRMTRFFMSIPEASQLVLQAAAMGKGGEIFVLEMGEPVRIVDLARDLVRLSGLPEDAIEIAFTGLRPGEKLFEELYFEDEETLPTSHPKLRAAFHRPFALTEVRKSIEELEWLMDGPEEATRRKLAELVPEYRATDVAPSPLVAEPPPRKPEPLARHGGSA